MPRVGRAPAHRQVYYIDTIDKGLFQGLCNGYRCTAIFIFLGVGIIFPAYFVSYDVGSGSDTLHSNGLTLDRGIDPVTRSDTGHEAAMKYCVLAHASFAGEIVHADELVIAQDLRFAAQAQLLTQWVTVVIAVRGRV